MSHFARTALVGAFVTATVLAPAGAAGAATIVEPAGSPTVVANAPMTVVVTGFRPGQNVFVVQCDGTAPTAPDWDPTLDCDNGASPPPAIADDSGRAEFPASNPDRAYRPFQGESPSALFNCVAAGVRAPANNLQTFTNCQLRVSSNNTATTDDQVFRPIVLSGRSVPLPVATTSTTNPKTSTTVARSGTTKRASGTHAAATSPAHTKNGTGATSTTITADASAHAGASASASATSSSGSGGAGVLGFSDGGVVTGYLLVVVGLGLAVLSALVATRRHRRAAVSTVTAVGTAGERT